jgi:hypothetical protein
MNQLPFLPGSGARLICHDGYIIKHSGQPDRLKAQHKKIQLLAGRSAGGVQLPKPYSFQCREKSASYKLPFLFGKDAIEFLQTTNRKQINWLAESLATFIESNQELSYPEDVSGKIKTKLDAISPTCRRMGFDTRPLYELIDTPLILKVGICHGDLTLANMVIDDKNNIVWLLDPLDSYIEAPVIDMTKLRQDTFHKWFLLKYRKPFDHVQINIALRYLDNILNERFMFSEDYKRYQDLIQAINLLRIVPYIKTDEELNVLRDRYKGAQICASQH